MIKKAKQTNPGTISNIYRYSIIFSLIAYCTIEYRGRRDSIWNFTYKLPL